MRKTIIASAVLAALGAPILLASPASAADNKEIKTLLAETFTGSTIESGFKFLGTAGLTNALDGSAFAPKVGADLKDASGKGLAIPQAQADARRGAPKPGEFGALQLTDNNHDKVGSLLYDVALPSDGGLDVTFEQYQYNSSTPKGLASVRGVANPIPADGIGFYLTDGAYSLDAPGAYGGSLGYAQKFDAWGSGWSSGVAHGYLGIGFDVLGNFAQDMPESRGAGSGLKSPAGSSWGQNVPNSVVLRGPGDGTTGYGYLTGTLSADGRTSTMPVSLGSTSAAPGAAKRNVRITVSPEAKPRVTVYVEGQNVVDYQMTTAMPETFKFGFSASTGDMTDVHLIRNLEVKTLVPVEVEMVPEVTDPADPVEPGAEPGDEPAEPVGPVEPGAEPGDESAEPVDPAEPTDPPKDAVPAPGNVVVHYVDATGRPLADDDAQSGAAGVDWQTTPKTIDGYRLVRTNGAEGGTFGAGSTVEVTYVYEPVAVTAVLVDDSAEDPGFLAATGGYVASQGQKAAALLALIGGVAGVSALVVARRPRERGKTGSAR